MSSAKQKGKEWVHVKITELKDKSHQHKYCKLIFVAGASRIRSTSCTVIQLLG